MNGTICIVLTEEANAIAVMLTLGTILDDRWISNETFTFNC